MYISNKDPARFESKVRCYDCNEYVGDLVHHRASRECEAYKNKIVICENCHEMVRNITLHRREGKCKLINKEVSMTRETPFKTRYNTLSYISK